MDSDDVGALADVASHYAAPNLLGRLLDGLAASGVDVERIAVEDLRLVDELHVRGREATEEQASLAHIGAEERVLDIGCGIGGSARYLAATRGCRVEGLDLTPEYVEAAIGLSERCGLGDRVTFQVGDATRLPFEDGSFDVVWTQHVNMNIADKRVWVGEIARVLKLGGRWAGYEILGNDSDIRFPVPWATSPPHSVLASAGQLRTLILETGLEIDAWIDSTEAGVAWVEKVLERFRESGAPPLGPRLLVGDSFGPKFENMRDGLRSGALAVAMFVARKP
jgi:ubiquinone/menaquinone biosynthesis C-methylase UbiE